MAPALFVYGSLMATEVLAAVLGPDKIAGLTLTPAVLEVSGGDAGLVRMDQQGLTQRPAAVPGLGAQGYARFRVRGEQYPAILPQPGGSVEGMLLRGLTPAQLARLDEYEGAVRPDRPRAGLVVQAAS